MIEESQEQELTSPPSQTEAVKIVMSFGIAQERAIQFVISSIFDGVVCEDTLYQLIDNYKNTYKVGEATSLQESR